MYPILHWSSLLTEYKTLRNPTSFSGKASFQKMMTHPRENRSNSQELLKMSSTAAVMEYKEYNHDEELKVSDDSYEADQYGPPGYYNSFDYETEEKS
ncbi:Hypothetical protein PHPALM_6227 [Phytophthora palmivora]|uniref:Uncharacterized protein n=1 Tax=Phytophthora palmivora TaxID=4796 RepID=A0A2P4YFC8_9STRA|nr:Hypothetical protein PHPALM_6227 [Phytophthora palmivora]